MLSFLSYFNANSLSFQAALSALVVLLGWGLNSLLSRLMKKRFTDHRDPELLSLLISTRNYIGFGCGVLIFFLWVGEIRHGLISIAALVAALILASKEMWSNFFGMVTRSIVRPFAVGDLVEVAGLRGRVVDMDSFTVRILVYGAAGQVTGKIAEIPNSTLLTSPVINHSIAGDYSFQFSQISVPLEGTDINKSARYLKQCAEEVCKDFTEEALAWFEQRGRQLHIEFPSGKPFVFISPKDYRQVDLILRFPCPAGKKVTIEQAILTLFYERFDELKKEQIIG